MGYPLFSFTQPQKNMGGISPSDNPYMQQALNQAMNGYQQQGQNLLDPGSTQLAQSDPYAIAGRQALGDAFQQTGQMGPPANTLSPSDAPFMQQAMNQAMNQDMPQQGVPMDADAYLQQKALAAGLMQQQNPWSITPDYPKPNFGGKQGVWGG